MGPQFLWSELSGSQKSNAEVLEELFLTNCLRAGDSDARVETHNLRLINGDRLLLCSDGLTDLVEDSAIAGVLNREEEPQAACDSLVQLALDRGGKDNITVVVAGYSVPA